MKPTLYLDEEAHALLVAGLKDFQTSNIYVCVKNVQTHLVVSCICVMYFSNIHDNGPEWLNHLIPLDLQLPDESIISHLSQASCKNQWNLIKNSSQGFRLFKAAVKCFMDHCGTQAGSQRHRQNLLWSWNTPRSWTYVPEMFRSNMRAVWPTRC